MNYHCHNVAVHQVAPLLPLGCSIDFSVICGYFRRKYNLTSNMCCLFQAEVRGFQHDGSLHLQARSQKYGKVCLVEDIY